MKMQTVNSILLNKKNKLKLLACVDHDFDVVDKFSGEPLFTIEKSGNHLRTQSTPRIAFPKKKKLDSVNSINIEELNHLVEEYKPDGIITSYLYAEEISKNIDVVPINTLDRLYVTIPYRRTEGNGKSGIIGLKKAFEPENADYYISSILNGDFPSVLSIATCIGFQLDNDKNHNHLKLLFDGYLKQKLEYNKNN